MLDCFVNVKSKEEGEVGRYDRRRRRRRMAVVMYVQSKQKAMNDRLVHECRSKEEQEEGGYGRRTSKEWEQMGVRLP